MSMDATDFINHGALSDCCGAPIMGEDICMDCKEHCEAVEIDDDPTPYCSDCGAKERKHCNCPPRAEDD